MGNGLPFGEISRFPDVNDIFAQLSGELKAFAEHPAVTVDVESTEYSDMAMRERRLFDKIYDAGLERAIANEDQVVLMFDVDQTIAEGNDRTGYAVRPGFVAAVQALGSVLGDRLRVGLLATTNDVKGARRACLADVEQYVDERLLIGTRIFMDKHEDLKVELEKMSAMERLERLKGVLREDAYAAIIEQCALGNTENLSYLLDHYYKTEIMARLHDEHPDLNLIWVDNMPAASMIRPDHPRIKGVWVGKEVHGDALWRTGAQNFIKRFNLLKILVIG